MELDFNLEKHYLLSLESSNKLSIKNFCCGTFITFILFLLTELKLSKILKLSLFPSS